MKSLSFKAFAGVMLAAGLMAHTAVAQDMQVFRIGSVGLRQPPAVV